MKPHKAIPGKTFVSKEENKCKEEFDLIPPDRIGNIDWGKCGCEYKLKATFAESFCLLFWLKSRSGKGTSCHSALMVNCPTISRTC